MTREAWRASLGLADDARVAVMVANLHGFKDHGTLLGAWRHLLHSSRLPSDQRQCLQLILAGAPGDRAAAIEAEMREPGMRGTARWIGPVSDIAGLLSAADLCVHSSMHEGLPNAVLEAMYAGLPVVGTDTRSLRQTLGVGAGAFLSPPLDAAALAERIANVVELDARDRNRIGSSNRARAYSQFTPDQLVRRACHAIQHSLSAAEAWLREDPRTLLRRQIISYKLARPFDLQLRRVWRR